MMKYDNSEALLFYASGEATKADFARGCGDTNFCQDVSLVPDGPFGGAIQCENSQRLAWKAPGNVYAERGTLSFYWRSRYPVGPTAFPIFRIGFSDHSSWDAVFLRVDWNGEGFEAFITDINLSRARIWYKMDVAPDKWTHIAVAWDENWGLKLYIDGEKVAEEYRPAVYFAGLDQFGPHSRAISHWQVQSDYNFTRGGDVAEIAIFDQMLCCCDIKALAAGSIPAKAAYAPDLADEAVSHEWLLRNGFDAKLPGVPDHACIRKVEVHDAYDLKRWWWKGCDGIRETTWPGVFNRSRLKGRNDYFQLPDWDCYSCSGDAITFHAPDEPYNHIEISGSAHGKVEIVDEHGSVREALFDRAEGVERSVNEIARRTGGRIRFTNKLREEPIGDFSLFNVYEGTAPVGVKTVEYTLRPGYNAACAKQSELADFIKGRFAAYERGIMTAVREGDAPELTVETTPAAFPFVNIIIPYDADDSIGLDGVELSFDCPEACKLAVRVKDPLWYLRDLANFTFSAGKGRKVLWLDTRDRVLPDGKCLYITIASDGVLPQNVTIRTKFKSAADCAAEHTLDRFTQLRDAYGHMTEERPLQAEYAMYRRYYGDMMDLLKVAPDHELGLHYYHDFCIHRQNRLGIEPSYVCDYKLDPVPEGQPAWAARQIEFLRRYKKLVNWYIDNRQIDNGEFGGGLSDDGDWVTTWDTLVNMDSDAEKVKKAIFSNTEAFYQQGMFTNGLCSIQADQLHSSEEGLVSLNGCINAELGNPLWLERAMETGRSIGWITGVNEAGHRHFRSTFFSGTVYAEDEPWGRSNAISFSTIGAAWQVLRFNGNPTLLRYMRELADSTIAHYDPETGTLATSIDFKTDEARGIVNRRGGGGGGILLPAWKLLGDSKYLNCIPKPKTGKGRFRFGGEDGNDGRVPYRPFKEGTDIIDKSLIAKRYESMNKLAAIREYYNTYGSPWIDRVFFVADTMCAERLASPQSSFGRYAYPCFEIKWKFANIGDDEKVAILSPITEEDHIKLVVCNVSDQTVLANIIGNTVKPGVWSVSYGVDTNDDDTADTACTSYEQDFEWTVGAPVELAPHATTVIEMKLVKPGVPYWERCDLGATRDDVSFYAHGMNVRIHSLGGKDSPATEIALKDACGNVLKCVPLPPLPAPVDLWPRYRDVSFNLHHIASLEGCYIEIDPEHKLCETTRANNIIKL